MCTKLDNMTDLIQRKRDKFVDQLIHDGRFTYLLFSEHELQFMFAICRRLSVCRLSVCL